jgi:hypothetical protein
MLVLEKRSKTSIYGRYVVQVRASLRIEKYRKKFEETGNRCSLLASSINSPLTFCLPLRRRMVRLETRQKYQARWQSDRTVPRILASSPHPSRSRQLTQDSVEMSLFNTVVSRNVSQHGFRPGTVGLELEDSTSPTTGFLLVRTSSGPTSLQSDPRDGTRYYAPGRPWRIGPYT